MAEISLEASVTTETKAAAAKTARLFFADHLRAVLVILVVLHHVALVYGASVEGFYYLEPPFTDPLAGLVLLIFVLFNQAWFMGAFFFLAGYFTPGSVDRKGPGAFARSRLLRLGVPLLVWVFVLNPISRIGWWLMPSELTGITNPLTWEIFVQAYSRLLGLGPLWFVALLLVFSLGYAQWRWQTRDRASAPQTASSFPGYLQIGLFILGLAAANYLVRIVIPIGESVSEFPTFSYLPQYMSFYVLGIIASRQVWLRTLPRSTGVVGLLVAAFAAVLLFPLAITGRLFSLEFTEAFINGMGNGHWQSAVYALWDSLFAVGLVLGLITLFRGLFNGESRFGRFLAQHSYTVYIIHIPVIVFLAYALRWVELASLSKFVLASVIIVPACFAAAFLVRRLPFASRVL